MKQRIATIIWNLSEYFEIGLGKYAPKVFETMIGIKGKLMDYETVDKENNLKQKNMKTFKVEGWYRYSNANEKDFIYESITCTSVQVALQIFTDKYSNVNFFKIYTTEN